jgi:hypothetical protein
MPDDLNRAVNLVRGGQMDRGQREALAALLLICGNATLPTPVVAAVFNVVEACTRTSSGDEPVPEQDKQ